MYVYDVRFYNRKLINTSTRRSAFSFTTPQRHHIIRSLIHHLNLRIDLDASLHKTLQPLANISSSVSQEDLKLCYLFIIPDLDEKTFFSDYKTATEFLKDATLASLQTLHKISPDHLHTMKIALARVLAAKPHSADVERLISVYSELFYVTCRKVIV